MDVIQGQTFVHSAHYERYEQLFCAIEGFFQFKLVPHIYRQEVYAGKPKMFPSSEAETGDQLQELLSVNQSPVNFFEPDFDTYPLFSEIGRKYSVQLLIGRAHV